MQYQGMFSEISQKCPKCGKDYTSDPHWKRSLKKHLERKNPCDRKKGETYLRKKSESIGLNLEEFQRPCWSEVQRYCKIKIHLVEN